MIIVKGLQKIYGIKTALDLPAFTFEEGKSYALCGANGSGKSTLLKLLCGLEKPTAGSVDNTTAHTAYMPQQSYGFSLSVLNNVLLTSKDKKTDTARATELLCRLGLGSDAKKNASRLSGGETEKLALARILFGTHDCLLLDEPTASMDIESSLTAEAMIAEYRENHDCTIIFATHSLRQAKRLADYVLFFKDGKLVESQTADKALTAPDTAELKQFLDFFN